MLENGKYQTSNLEQTSEAVQTQPDLPISQVSDAEFWMLTSR